MIRPLSRRRRLFSNAEAVAQILSEQYRDHAHSNKSNPLDELLFIICSLKTNETRYQATYANLRSRFPTMRLLAAASETDIATALADGGLARQKAGAIRKIFSRLNTEFGSPTLSPLRAMTDASCEAFLTSLPGVGKKTARCVMLYSLRRQVFPVDSNCWRICRRLAWARPTRPDKSCSSRDMDRVQSRVDPALRHSLHVNFVSHGRAICRPAAPKCHECRLRHLCPRIGLRTPRPKPKRASHG